MVQGRLAELLAVVADEFGIRLALLFGSAATGRAHPRSDIDVALLMESPGLPLAKFAELHHALQQAVPENELDLSLINRADPLFLKKILESCRLLYGEERTLQKLRIYSFRRYQDHRRFLRFEREYVKRVVEEPRG